MKKFTLLKLAFVIAAAMSLYGQVKSGPTPDVCPPSCIHLTCNGGLSHAHCSNGQCVCP